MGGKKQQQQSQRTKGNARPSSSSQAAGQLERACGSTTGFIGFQALSGDLGYVPVAGGNGDESDTSIDADFRMVLRRMSKRDPTTRLKALQELCSLCGEKDVAAVQTVLPFWPRIYTKLAYDTDRRVRETTHAALDHLAGRVGRDLAPHLKALMGVWLCGQCDPYAPAASAARRAFVTALPGDDKQHGALLHCRKSIMDHVHDNLITQTASTLSDPKTTSAEDKESKYERVLACSLAAWRKLVQTTATELTDAQREELGMLYAAILGDGKFWKLAKHASSGVRAAWLWLVAALCQAGGMEPFAARICPAVLHRLDEGDPVEVCALWEAALSVVAHVCSCWTHVNIRKGVLPSLWRMLKQGGRGNAASVYPSLLPLLATLPPSEVMGEEPSSFYQVFFTNHVAGLTAAEASPSETAAIITSLFECCRYALVRHSDDLPQDGCVQSVVMDEVLLPLLDTALRRDSSPLHSSPLYSLTVSLLAWLQDKHPALAAVMWEGVETLLRSILSRPAAPYILKRITSLLTTFRRPASGKHMVRVSFGEGNSTSSVKHNKLSDARNVALSLLQDTNSHLWTLLTAVYIITQKMYTSTTHDAATASSANISETTSAPDVTVTSPAVDVISIPSASDLTIMSMLADVSPSPAATSISSLTCHTTTRSLAAVGGILSPNEAAICGHHESGIVSGDSVHTEASKTSQYCAANSSSNVTGSSPEGDKNDSLHDIIDDSCSKDVNASQKESEIHTPPTSVIASISDIDTSPSGVPTTCSHSRNVTPPGGHTSSDTSETPLYLLAHLFDNYCNSRLLNAAVSAYCADGGFEAEDDESVAVQYLRRVILPMCHRHDPGGHHSDTTSELLIMWMYSVFAAARTDGKVECLKLIYEELRCSPLLSLFTRRVLSECSESNVSTWFRGHGFGAHVVSATRWLYTHAAAADADEVPADAEPRLDAVKESVERGARWHLLTVALTVRLHNEVVLSLSSVASILEIMTAALTSSRPPTATCREDVTAPVPASCLRLVCDVMTLLYANVTSCAVTSHGRQVLSELFTMDCVGLPGGLQVDIERTWCEGVKAQMKEMGSEGMTEDAVRHLARILMTHACEARDLSTVDRLAGTGLRLLAVVALHHAASSEGVSSLACCLYTNVPPHADTGWWLAPLVSGSLGVMCPRPLLDSPLSPWTMLAPALFTSTVMKGVLDDVGDSSDAPASCSVSAVALLLTALAACRPLAVAHTGVEFNLAFTQLEDYVQAVIARLPSSHRMHIVQQMIDDALSPASELMSSVALKEAISLIDPSILEPCWAEQLVGRMMGLLAPPTYSFATSTPSTATDNTLAFQPNSLCAAQVLAPYLPPVQRRDVAALCAALLTSCDVTESGLNSVKARAMLLLVAALLEPTDAPTQLSEEEDESAGVLLGVVEKLQQWKEQSLLLLDCPIGECSWEALSLNTAAMRFLQLAVTTWPHRLRQAHWDFVLCSVVGWLQSVHESGEGVLTWAPGQAFTVAACRLLTAVAQFMDEVLPGNAARYPADMAQEWGDLFSEAAYTTVLPCFIRVTGETDLAWPSPAGDVLLTAISAAAARCPGQHLLAHHLPPALIADQPGHLPDSVASLLNHLCPLLLAPHRPTQLAAASLLDKVVPGLSGHDDGMETGVEQEEVARPLPAALISVLDASHVTVMGHVGEHVVEAARDWPSLEPDTEEYTAAVAYLLAWRLLLAFFRQARAELKAEYAAYMRDEHLVADLLGLLFRGLLPDSPALPAHGATGGGSMFEMAPALRPTDPASTTELRHLACHVYFAALKELPAAVRQWWNSQDRHTAALIEKFTTAHVSPLLCAAELSALHTSDVNSENLSVRVRAATREVVALYTVQEFSMELVVCLPANQPLGPITVSSERHRGVQPDLWRKWLLQMTTFLTHQNGSLSAGVLLWKRNVDKRFEGVEDCPVCFSVIHGSNYQLPRLTCRVCKKRFHSACLYKWFNTSGNSTCPLCRSLF